MDTEATPAAPQVAGSGSPTHAQPNTMGAPEEGTRDAISSPMEMESTPASQHYLSAMPPCSNCSNTKAPAAASTPSNPPVQTTAKIYATIPASSLVTAARVTTGTTSITPASTSASPTAQAPPFSTEKPAAKPTYSKHSFKTYRLNWLPNHWWHPIPSQPWPPIPCSRIPSPPPTGFTTTYSLLSP